MTDTTTEGTRRDLTSEMVHQWLLTSRADNTYKARALDMEVFRTWLREAAPVTWSQLTVQHAEQYVAWLKQQGYANGTINRRLYSIRAFYTWLQRPSPFDRVKKLRVSDVSTKRWLNVKEMARFEIAAGAPGLPLAERLAGTLLLHGLRAEEIRYLNINSLMNVGDHTMFRVTSKKTSNERMIHPSKQLQLLWEARKFEAEQGKEGDGARLVWNGGEGQDTVPHHWIVRVTKKLGKHAMIPDPEKLSPHVLRRSVCHAAYYNGAPLTHVQHMLGHTDIATTLAYIARFEEEDETAMTTVHQALDEARAALEAKSKSGVVVQPTASNAEAQPAPAEHASSTAPQYESLSPGGILPHYLVAPY